MIAAAIAFALGTWWFSTGAMLWLVRRPRAFRGWTLLGSSLLAAAAVVVLVLTRSQTTSAGGYAAFTAAVVVWGWHELSFLTGLIAGPSDGVARPEARGWARFRDAAATVIHHEIALALTAAVVVALTIGSANPTGGWTFLALFAARLSAKLNLFLGAPNFSVELFPPRLRHLATHLRKGPVSTLFPLSLAGLGLAALGAAALALAPEASPAAATGYALVFALLALAALEHLFMALPVPDAALWRWALPANDRAIRRVPVGADAVETLN